MWNGVVLQYPAISGMSLLRLCVKSQWLMTHDCIITQVFAIKEQVCSCHAASPTSRIVKWLKSILQSVEWDPLSQGPFCHLLLFAEIICSFDPKLANPLRVFCLTALPNILEVEVYSILVVWWLGTVYISWYFQMVTKYDDIESRTDQQKHLQQTSRVQGFIITYSYLLGLQVVFSVAILLPG